MVKEGVTSTNGGIIEKIEPNVGNGKRASYGVTESIQIRSLYHKDVGTSNFVYITIDSITWYSAVSTSARTRLVRSFEEVDEKANSSKDRRPSGGGGVDLTESHLGVADAKLVAMTENLLLVDLPAIDLGAVEPEVADPPLSLIEMDPRVHP